MMRHRRVVTVFLRHPDDGTVLLGRRSGRVSTYPDHWAAISGAIEGDSPLAHAYREIREETGLGSDAVELLDEGWPLRLPDWDLGVIWVVHPFLFKCNVPGDVRPDWEHVEFEWMSPARMSGLTTVPRLVDAYAVVAASAPPLNSTRVFELVRDDRTHGAEELGLWTLEGLKRAADEGMATAAGPDELTAAVAAACRQAAALRPSIAPVLSAALRAYGVCREGPAGSRVVDRITALFREREDRSIKPAEAAAPLIPTGAWVVTLSYSFTGVCALMAAADRIGRLTVAESRPAFEGRETARLAASLGIPTQLATDAAAVRATQEADVVLFGADSVCPDGTVVNKTGTFALCCAARRFGVRTLCVTTESKILPAGYHPPMEEMPPGELGEPIAGVQTRNAYFEAVPPDLVDCIITGTGRLDPERLRRTAEELRELANELGV